MIIQRVSFINFGIYGGEREYDLVPAPTEQYNRPIILFSGKNGVGKTTFVEGIRFGLHGSLSLGPRVGQQEFLDYLGSRIHRPADSTSVPDGACIEIVFEYVRVGRRLTYRVRRSWSKYGKRIEHKVEVWEDEQLLDALDQEQREALLRELVPPGIVDLFFFDGEKVLALANSDNKQFLFSDTVKSLLGLNLIEQLEKDLDTYIARADDENGHSKLQNEVEDRRKRKEKLDEKALELRFRLEEVLSSKVNLQTLLAEQEHRISEEGGAYSERREILQTERIKLEAKAESLQREAMELCNGLIPFAIAPKMLEQVLDRLTVEREYEEAQTARQLLEQQLALLSQQMSATEFWMGTKLNPTQIDRKHLIDQVAQVLKQSLPQSQISPEEIILHVSDKEREVLVGWLEQAQKEVPLKFSRLIIELERLKTQIKQIEDELTRVPADETLKPLAERLQALSYELGQLDKIESDLRNELASLAYENQQNAQGLNRVYQELKKQKSATSRLDLAARTQLLLEEYGARLIQRKMVLLQEAIVEHFNRLCRKHSLIDRATIDSETFAIKLYRAGQVFTREELSAGERQLLAIATLWGMRDITGIPAPVIIDTPLSRLDSEHRQSMLQHFFPHASHQVIILATDAEFDQEIIERLAPAISHIFWMEYDPETGSTNVVREVPDVKLPNLSLIDTAGVTLA